MLGNFFRSPQPAQEKRSNGLIDLGQYIGLRSPSYAYTPTYVSAENALTHAATYACIDILATSVSGIPFKALRMTGGKPRPLDPQPPLIASPSSMVEPDVWKYQIIESMCSDGNAFGMITTTDAFGRPTTIETLDPGTVQDRKVVDGVAQVSINGRVHQLYPHGDVWHVPGKMVKAGKVFGDSPIKQAMATIGTALAAREYGARFFGDGGRPGAILTSEEQLSLEQAQLIKDAWRDANAGTRDVAVMGAGLTYTKVTTDPKDSQFIPLLQFLVEEACRFWRVPPRMVYASISGQSVTYSNVSQADLDYLKHSLDFYLVRLETAKTRLLARPQIVIADRSAMLRGDVETRSDIADQRLRNKSLSINEYRIEEGEEPYPDPAFDEPGIPGEPIPVPGKGVPRPI